MGDILLFQKMFVLLQSENKLIFCVMSTLELNKLWAYIQGLDLEESDRNWLVGKLLEPVERNEEQERQKAYVKESLTCALQEVKDAKREGRKLQTIEEFEKELEMEGIL